MRRALVSCGLMLVGLAGGVLFACTDDATSKTAPGPEDAGPIDVRPDAGGDGEDAGGEDAGSEAGSIVSSSLGTTGWIRVAPDAVFADFREDDTIVRASDAPDCVVHVYSKSKLFSEAGKLTIGGEIVGSDGGAATLLELDPMLNPAGYQYELFGEIYPPESAPLGIEIQTEGTASVPALPVQSVKTPLTDVVTITKPAAPDGGALVVPSNQPFEITWTVPAGVSPDQRLGVSIVDLDPDGGGVRGAIHCGFPLSQGQGSIATSLLAELKSRLKAPANGLLILSAGGQKEATPPGASYIIEVARGDGTSLEPTDITLE